MTLINRSKVPMHFFARRCVLSRWAVVPVVIESSSTTKRTIWRFAAHDLDQFVAGFALLTTVGSSGYFKTQFRRSSIVTASIRRISSSMGT